MTAKDPVCGMQVEPAKAAGTLKHGGATYYFCSKNCLESFRKDPVRYVGHAGHAHHAHHAHEAAKPAPAAPAGAQYTCPMHPEILKDGPGDCPICGMVLVPVGAAEEDDTELRDHTRRLRMHETHRQQDEVRLQLELRAGDRLEPPTLGLETYARDGGHATVLAAEPRRGDRKLPLHTLFV